MKHGLKYSISLFGLAASWEGAKAFVIPTLFWTGTAVGTAEYVHWVIKSHYSSVAMTDALAAQQKADADGNGAQFMEAVTELVTREDAFLESLRTKVVSPPADGKIARFARENADMLSRADRLRGQIPANLAADVATRVAQLRALDTDLQAFGKVAAKGT